VVIVGRRRAGRPADIGATVRYLVGPDSGYITGQILSVNGGIVFGR
jgi:NAD(P)-dependent dehydrogenase (short-subunit alcohol dehydrogenase family)